MASISSRSKVMLADGVMRPYPRPMPAVPPPHAPAPDQYASDACRYTVRGMPTYLPALLSVERVK